MTRKKFKHLLLELSRSYLQVHGNLKGFGKIAKYYDYNWCVKWNEIPDFKSYNDLWNCNLLKDLRRSVNM